MMDASGALDDVDRENQIALPTSAMLAAIGLGAAAFALAWFLVTQLSGWGPAVRAAGVWGALVSGSAAASSLLLIGPWKPRPIAVWMSFWMGATAFRLLVTPMLAWLLYSATRLPGQALVVAVAATYFISLLAEAAVLARHIGRVTRPQSQQQSSNTP